MSHSIRSVAAVLALASLGMAAWAFQPDPKPSEKAKDAQPAPAEGTRPPRGEGKGPGGPRGEGAGVEGGMRMMNRSFKALKGQISDASKKDENLRLINDMQRGCVTAKGQPLPPDVLKKAKDDAEKAKWQKEFRGHLIGVLRKLIDVEQAIIDGKGSEAGKVLTEVQQMRDESHKALGVSEDE